VLRPAEPIATDVGGVSSQQPRKGNQAEPEGQGIFVRPTDSGAEESNQSDEDNRRWYEHCTEAAYARYEELSSEEAQSLASEFYVEYPMAKNIARERDISESKAYQSMWHQFLVARLCTERRFQSQQAFVEWESGNAND